LQPERGKDSLKTGGYGCPHKKKKNGRGGVTGDSLREVWKNTMGRGRRGTISGNVPEGKKKKPEFFGLHGNGQKRKKYKKKDVDNTRIAGMRGGGGKNGVWWVLGRRKEAEVKDLLGLNPKALNGGGANGHTKV